MARTPDFEFRIEPLDREHDRAAFACGIESLDTYLKTQASQDLRRKANAVFVMVAPSRPEEIVGYFTLCALALEQGAVPEAARKYVPRYPLVSATLIGRLAVAKPLQGQGLGGALLARALRLAYDNASLVGSSMIIVDPIDEAAARFYEAHGFLRLRDSMRMILPMATVGKIIGP
jgi:GNAT superfamily N-acetyltransferase